ncbi:MAG: PAS domain S-box protein [Sphingobacteriales bacterium]|nr:PAS domain S-box protein [Sphingobacteriales bacterium]
MNRFYTRQSLSIGVIISFALVSFIAWYSWVSMKKARFETSRVNKTLQSLKVLENLLDDVQDIETANRGFLISGNREFLTPYKQAIRNLGPDTTGILNMREIYPGRKDTLEQLVGLANRKLALANMAEALVERGRVDSALLLVRSGRGKEMMDSIRQIVWSLETRDRVVLNTSNAIRETAATTTARLFVLLSAGFIVVASLLFYISLRGMKRKDAYETRIAYLASLTERTSDAIISVNADQEIISWNKGAENIYGYTAAEAVGKKISSLVRSGVREQGDEAIKKEIAEKGSAGFESNDYTRDGKSIFCHVSMTALKDRQGQLTGFVSVVRDITQRKLAEKLIYAFNHELAEKVREKTEDLRKGEEKLRQMLDSAVSEFYVIDLDYRVILISKMAEYSLERAWGKAVRAGDHIIEKIPAENKQVILANYKKTFEGAFIEYETRLDLKDEIKWVNITYNPVRGERGNITGAFIGTRDITARKAAESELQESENRFRAIFNTQLQLVCLLDKQGLVLEVNKTALDITGYKNEDIIGKPFWEIRLWEVEEERPERIQKLKAAIDRALAGEFIRYEGTMKLPGREMEVFDFSIKPVPGADGETQQLLIEGRLITEIKKAENEVKESEAKYRAFFEYSMDGILLTSADGEILAANPAACRMFGMSVEELIRAGRNGIVDPADKRIEDLFGEGPQKGNLNGELNFIRKDQTKFPGEFSSAVFMDGYGRERISLIIRDVTERKRIEAEIRQSNKRFEMISRTTRDAIWEWDLLTGKKWANETHQLLYGLKPGDPVPDEEEWRNHIHPDDRAHIVNRQEATLASDRNVFISEYRFRTVRGGYVYLFDRCYIERDAEGLPVRMTGSMMNITDRKHSEEKLRESEQRLRLSMEAAKQGLYDLNLQTHETIVNEQYALMLGYDPHSFFETKESWLERLHPDDRDATQKAFTSYISGETHEFRKEFRQQTKGGDWKWILSTGKIVSYDAAGRPLRMMGTHTDITGSKKAEEELIKSQKRFQNLVENISGVYWVNDLYTRQTLYISPSYETIWGRKCQDLYHNPADFLLAVHPDDRAELTRIYEELSDNKQVRTDYRIIRPQGDTRWIAARINVITGPDGKRTEYGYAEDVTEQRRAEAELVESNARFQIVSKATSDIVWDWNLQTNELWWNDNYYSSLGYQKEKEIVYIDEWYDHIHPEERDRVRQNANKTFRGKSTVWRDEYRYRKADGGYLHFLDRGFIMRDESGIAVRMIGSMTDMTPVYTAQRKIEESEIRLRTILDTDPECIKLIDKDGCFMDINKAGLQMLEAEQVGEILGLRVLPFIGEKHKEQVENTLRDAFGGKAGVIDYEMITLKQNKKWCEMNVVPFRDTAGNVVSVLGVTRDITERKKAELAVRFSEEKYRTLVEQAADTIALYDEKGNILDTNTSAFRLLGYTREELAGMRLDQVLLPEEIEENPIQYDVLSAGISTVKIRRMRRKDGSVVITEVRSQKLPDGRFLSVVRDMTERIRAEEELKSSYKAIRNLTAHLQNIREEERANIAREIHDELGQQLTVLKMDIAWLNKRFQGVDEKVNLRLKDLLIMLDETVQSVRRIASQLRPSLLDDLGLTAAMEWQLGEFEKRAGIKTSFLAPQEEIPVPDAAKTALFRIFQESLTNVVRHSSAKKVSVELREEEDQLVMTIMDDGKGFEPGKVADKKTLGILGMKERSEMMGGRYEIRSVPGEGTAVVVSVPVSKFA